MVYLSSNQVYVNPMDTRLSFYVNAPVWKQFYRRMFFFNKEHMSAEIELWAHGYELLMEIHLYWQFSKPIVVTNLLFTLVVGWRKPTMWIRFTQRGFVLAGTLRKSPVEMYLQVFFNLLPLNSLNHFFIFQMTLDGEMT